MRIQNKVHKYLKFKKKLMRGGRICKNLGLPLKSILEFDRFDGIGGVGQSFGNLGIRKLVRFEKINLFDANNICFIIIRGRVFCRKPRKMREGKFPPRFMPMLRRLKNQKE